MDPEAVDGRFRGCQHETFVATVKDVEELLQCHPQYVARGENTYFKEDSTQQAGKFAKGETIQYQYTTSKKVIGKLYNMEDYLDSCITLYAELAGINPDSITPKPTPFIDESQDPCHYKGETVQSKVDNAAKADKKGKEIPREGNQLARIAAKVLMKLMYCARYGRFDLLRAIGRLASYITKWDSLCDKKLHRLIQYVKFSKGIRQMGFVGDPKEDLTVNLFTDADYAGTNADMKSTNGIFLAITGPNTFFPIAAQSKKQGCVSRSTPEAELIAMDYGLRLTGLPALTLWEVILGHVTVKTDGSRVPTPGRKRIVLDTYQDNTAISTIAHAGKAPTLKHVHRTHGVAIEWVHEVVTGPEVALYDCHTNAQAADIFTKFFVNVAKWVHNLTLIGVVAVVVWKRFKRVESNETHTEPNARKGNVAAVYRAPRSFRTLVVLVCLAAKAAYASSAMEHFPLPGEAANAPKGKGKQKPSELSRSGLGRAAQELASLTVTTQGGLTTTTQTEEMAGIWGPVQAEKPLTTRVQNWRVAELEIAGQPAIKKELSFVGKVFDAMKVTPTASACHALTSPVIWDGMAKAAQGGQPVAEMPKRTAILGDAALVASRTKETNENKATRQGMTWGEGHRFAGEARCIVEAYADEMPLKDVIDQTASEKSTFDWSDNPNVNSGNISEKYTSGSTIAVDDQIMVFSCLSDLYDWATIEGGHWHPHYKTTQWQTKRIELAAREIGKSAKVFSNAKEQCCFV